jgi:hypothetical protein
MMMNRYTNPIRAGIVRVNNQRYHRSSFSVGTADGPLDFSEIGIRIPAHDKRLGLSGGNIAQIGFPHANGSQGELI